MKRLNKLFIAGMAAAALSGCRPDLLDTAPYDGYSSENMWQDESTCQQGVTGVYQVLRKLYVETSMDGNQKAYIWTCHDPSTTWRDNSSAFMNYTATSSDGMASELWKKFYEGVSRANDALDNLANAPISESNKAHLTAEVKFLRAWFYYNLNVLFRGVPLYLTSVTSEEAKTYSRSSEEDVWKQVVKDLTDCINTDNLELKYDEGNANYGKITKGAVYALRGKVYLWMKNWPDAAKDFEEVKNCGYALFEGAGADSYAQLFKAANEQCPEMIFSVQCIDQDSYGNALAFRYGGRSIFDAGGGWNTYLVSTDFVDSYENQDGTEFHWDDIIPGFSSTDMKKRQIYFLRDTVHSVLDNAIRTKYGYTDEAEIKSIRNQVCKAVKSLWDPEPTTDNPNPEPQLEESTKSLYIDGNEARVKKAYENRDPRLKMTVLTPYSEIEGAESGVAGTYTVRWPFVFKGTGMYDYRTDTSGQLYYLYRKFVPLPGEASTRFNSPIDLPLIRYAEVLLGWAEALNEQGDWQGAMDKVNEVRDRAGVARLTAAKYGSQDAMRVRIQKERRWEFAGENVTWYEELRCKTWKESKFNNADPNNPAGLKQCWGENSFTYTWGGDDYYIWPIPKQEIDMNSNLKQNPGWE